MSTQRITLSNAISFKNGQALKARKKGVYTIYGSNGPIGNSLESNNENAIIIGRVGAYCGSIEVCEEKFWASDNTIIASPNGGQDLFYWYYRLKSFPLRNYAGGSAQPLLTQSALKPLKITAHTLLGVQKKIGELIKAYDDLIENNNRRIELLEEAARLLYKEWFVHLRFPGHEHVNIIDGVPEGWKQSVVSDLGKVITGKTPPTKDEDNFGADVPFIKTPDMHASSIVTFPEEYLSEKGAKSQIKKYLPPYSILVACIGAKLGVVTFNRYEAQTNQQINAVIPKDDSLRYFSYFLLESFKPRLQAIGGGATMPNVNKSKFSSLDFILPVQNLLEIFDSYAQANFEQMAQLIVMNKKLEEARDILLPRLMNGELAV